MATDSADKMAKKPRTQVRCFASPSGHVQSLLAGGLVAIFACTPARPEAPRDSNDVIPAGGQPGTGGTGGTASGSAGSGGRDFGVGGFPAEVDAGTVVDAAPPRDALEDCGSASFPVSRTPPNLILVLDRSGSMRRTVQGEAPTETDITRWAHTTKAIESVVSTTQGDIAWGLKMFPTCTHMPGQPPALNCFKEAVHDPCSVAGFNLDPDINQAQGLTTEIAGAAPVRDTGSTPTRLAVDAAVALMKSQDDDRPQFLLLATDGLPQCGVDPLTNEIVDTRKDALGAVAAVERAQADGIPVFVLGIAVADPESLQDLPAGRRAGLLEAHENLNALAVAGGRPQDDDTKYYSALNETMLTAALNEIAAETVSCVFVLAEAPEDDAVTTVDVFVDDEERRLLPSATDGWAFGPGKRSIIFTGEACDKLKRGEFTRTEVNYQCPGDPLPEPPPVAL